MKNRHAIQAADYLREQAYEAKDLSVALTNIADAFTGDPHEFNNAIAKLESFVSNIRFAKASRLQTELQSNA